MHFSHIITGASGFLGSHLCRDATMGNRSPGAGLVDLLPPPVPDLAASRIDISAAAAVRELAQAWTTDTLIHLAAEAEVVIPFDRIARLDEVNVRGTLNLLEAFTARRVVFASSSAVYGTAPDRMSRPGAGADSPVGVYGVTKLMGELACNDWAAARRASAVSLRFGNIVGSGCRGLVPHLVAHAVRDPDATTPVQLRGGGRIIRDYLPVQHAASAVLRAAELPLADGSSAIFNVGSGMALSNGEVARFVADRLARHDYHLQMNFDNPVPAGESAAVVLDVGATTRALDLPPPGRDAIFQALDDAVLSHLARLTRPTG